MEFRGECLRSVFVLPESEDPAPLKIQAVELYDDGVVVRWVFPGDSPEWSFDADVDQAGYWPALSVEDDVGTRYRDAGGHGGGGATYRGESAFVPRVPDRAARLFIQGADGRVTLELPQR